MARKGKEKDTGRAFRPEASNPCLAPDYAEDDDYDSALPPQGGWHTQQEDYYHGQGGDLAPSGYHGFLGDEFDEYGAMNPEEEEDDSESSQARRASLDL